MYCIAHKGAQWLCNDHNIVVLVVPCVCLYVMIKSITLGNLKEHGDEPNFRPTAALSISTWLLLMVVSVSGTLPVITQHLAVIAVAGRRILRLESGRRVFGHRLLGTQSRLVVVGGGGGCFGVPCPGTSGHCSAIWAVFRVTFLDR